MFTFKAELKRTVCNVIEEYVIFHVQYRASNVALSSTATLAPWLFGGGSEHQVEAISSHIYSRCHPEYRVPARKSLL